MKKTKFKKVLVAAGISSTLLVSSFPAISSINVSAQTFELSEQDTYYDEGNNPTIAVNEEGRVFEAHEAVTINFGNGTVYYNLGKMNGSKITWDKGNDNGTRIYIAEGVSITDLNHLEALWLDNETIFLTGTTENTSDLRYYILKVEEDEVKVKSSGKIDVPNQSDIGVLTTDAPIKTIAMDENGDLIKFFINEEDQDIHFVVGTPDYNTSGDIIDVNWGSPIATNNPRGENDTVGSFALGKDGTIVAVHNRMNKDWDGKTRLNGQAFMSIGKIDQYNRVTWYEKNKKYDDNSLNPAIAISGNKLYETYSNARVLTDVDRDYQLKLREWIIGNDSKGGTALHLNEDKGFFNEGKQIALTALDGYLVESHAYGSEYGDDLFYSVTEAEENISIDDFKTTGVTKMPIDETVYGAPAYQLTADREDKTDYLNYTVNGNFQGTTQTFSVWLKADQEQTATLRFRSDLKDLLYEPDDHQVDIQVTDEWKEYEITVPFQLDSEFMRATIYPAGRESGTGSIYAANPQIIDGGTIYTTNQANAANIYEVDNVGDVMKFAYYLNLNSSTGETASLRREKLYPNGNWGYTDYNITDSGVWEKQSDWDTLYRMKITVTNSMNLVSYVTPEKYYYMPKPIEIGDVLNSDNQMIVKLKNNVDQLGAQGETAYLRREKLYPDGSWGYTDWKLSEDNWKTSNIWSKESDYDTEYRMKLVLKKGIAQDQITYESDYVYYTMPAE
ncbi:hypothetical protein WAK64_11580 [Bacillus spongiae]|uniref:CBM-cenC domain-containing protein n=1 Tax=Bacillus spongiae TaxID=2683610 RepID=A0ABU8HEA9_9BACI